MDEDNFPVAFNDVDLCLRIGERGYAVVWTPHAELYHLESATRGVDVDDAESLARLERDSEKLKQRWGEILSRDPFYNPNCALTTADFEPGFPPLRRKPWLTFKARATNILDPWVRSEQCGKFGKSAIAFPDWCKGFEG